MRLAKAHRNRKRWRVIKAAVGTLIIGPRIHRLVYQPRPTFKKVMFNSVNRHSTKRTGKNPHIKHVNGKRFWFWVNEDLMPDANDRRKEVERMAATVRRCAVPVARDVGAPTLNVLL